MLLDESRSTARIASPKPLTLEDRLLAAGIRPIPKEVLEQHKAAQLRRYPASFALRASPGAFAGLRAAIVFAPMLVVAVLAISLDQPWFMMGLPFGILFGGIFLQMPRYEAAVWIENWTRRSQAERYEVPAAALQLWDRARAAGMTDLAVVGKLHRERAILDPYLCITDQVGARACLAIWEGDKIIHLATTSENH